MSPEAWIALAALAVTVGSGLVSYLAAGKATEKVIGVKLVYMSRDIEETRRSVRAAHWRLDEIQAPPAPTVDR